MAFLPSTVPAAKEPSGLIRKEHAVCGTSEKQSSKGLPTEKGLVMASKMVDALVLDDIWSQGYGMVAKSVMRAKELSAEAKAIYSYLCSFQGGVNGASMYQMQCELGMPETCFSKALEELEGYMAACGHPLRVYTEAA